MLLAASVLLLSLQQVPGLEKLQDLQSQGSSNDIRVVNNNVHKTLACSGNSVYLLGNGGVFTVTGQCAAVYVRGNGNSVQVQSSGSIAVEGNNNKVSWQSKATKSSNPGNGNTLTAPR